MTRRSRFAVTVVEMLIVVVLGSLILGTVIALLGTGTRLGVAETEGLGLQVDAQRSISLFLKDLQQGMQVILPQPGQTHPQAVVRDHRNRLIHYSLTGSGALQRSEVDPAGTRTREVLAGVERLAFTAQTDGALRVHLALRDKDHRVAVLTQVRMRNHDAAFQ
jgi:hypothetical protein